MSALFSRRVCTQGAEEAPSPDIEVNDNSDSMAYYRLTQSTGQPLCVSEAGGEEAPAPSLRLACECETPLLSGERNLSLVDSVGNDTTSILGAAAGSG